jgi:hypothetical protein
MTYRAVLGYKQAMESRGCPVRFKKTTTFAQIALLAHLLQIPHFIAPTESFRYHMINVHWAFGCSTLLTRSIALEHSFSGFSPSS